jgi:Glycosyl transferase family 2.
MSGENHGTRFNVYVLAKNEEANIARCLDSVCRHGLGITVLDSGSKDRTVDIASTYPTVKVVPYAYKSHCDAGNEICTSNLDGYEYVMILDADMVVSGELIEEIKSLTRDGQWDVVKAPVRMFVEGKLLPKGSLYPPKAFVFKVGRTYFVPSGHGEALQDDCHITQTNCSLVHDDRKDYDAYLMSQVRYARNLLLRAKNGALSARDLMRLNTPLMMFVVPAFSYFIRLGFLSGKAGLIYAIDRLIAEAIMFRQSLSERM